MENLSGSSILVVTGIWSIVFIGYYVWYLWSLSRLFPKLGLPSLAGWVPVWNQWQLVQRGGLPGWLVLLGLIPFLGVVVLVVMIIAINRINSEHGKGPGFTVLGVVLPPLWAMLLTNHIRDFAYAGPSSGAARPAVASGIPGFGPQSTGAESNATDWQGLPPVPQPAFQQPSQHTYGQPQQPVQPQFGQPQQPVQPHAPQQPAAPHTYAQPQQPSTHQQPLTPQQQLWAEPARQQVPSAVPTQAPQPRPAQSTPIPPAPVAAPPAAPASQVPPPPAAPIPPAPAAPTENWGFSNTTEGAFERLAAEDAQRSGSTPLGAAQSQRQFSWPSADSSDNADVDSRSPLVLPGPPERAEQAPAAPAAQAPAAQAPAAQVPAAQVPAPAVHSDDEAPSIFDTGSSRRSAATAAEGVAEHTGTASAVPAAAAARASETAGDVLGAAAVTAAAVTGAAGTAAVEGAAGTAAGTAAGAAASETAASGATTDSTDAAAHDEELDRTVVVVRKARWGLELPDGDMLELLTDDVVLGRKPEAPEGASVLQIVDPTRTMSKTHARLRRDGEQWTIEDLDSTNGVAVIDAEGQATQIDAGRAVAATPRLVIGTLEVKLQTIS